MGAIPADAAETPGRQDAQQRAAQELAQGKYHVHPAPTPSAPSSTSPTRSEEHTSELQSLV